MEVDVRSEEKKKRCLYFFIKDRWEEVYFCGLPESVKFAITLEGKDSSVCFISFEELSSPTEKRIEREKKFWFSFEDEEEYGRIQREKNNKLLEYCTSLNSLSLLFSDTSVIKREDNRINREGDREWEHCLFGDVMSEGIHRITFSVCGYCLIGLIDASERLPLNGKSITESHIDGEMYNCKNELVGNTNYRYFNSFITMEVDLRPKEEDKKILKYIVNNKQQECYFYNLPAKVSLRNVSHFFGRIEFVSYEKLKEPTTIDAEGKKGIDWGREKGMSEE